MLLLEEKTEGSGRRMKAWLLKTYYVGGKKVIKKKKKFYGLYLGVVRRVVREREDMRPGSTPEAAASRTESRAAAASLACDFNRVSYLMKTPQLQNCALLTLTEHRHSFAPSCNGNAATDSNAAQAKQAERRSD